MENHKADFQLPARSTCQQLQGKIYPFPSETHFYGTLWVLLLGYTFRKPNHNDDIIYYLHYLDLNMVILILCFTCILRVKLYLKRRVVLATNTALAARAVISRMPTGLGGFFGHDMGLIKLRGDIPCYDGLMAIEIVDLPMNSMVIFQFVM